jgi:hypothetical protein
MVAGEPPAPVLVPEPAFFEPPEPVVVVVGEAVGSLGASVSSPLTTPGPHAHAIIDSAPSSQLRDLGSNKGRALFATTIPWPHYQAECDKSPALSPYFGRRRMIFSN